MKTVLATLLLGTTPLTALANPADLPANVPIPFAAPRAILDETTTTGAIRAAMPRAVINDAGETALMKDGLDAISGGNLSRARQMRDRMTRNGLERRIVTWAIALSGADALPSNEIAQIAQELADWPGMSTLRDNSERALYRENPTPQAVVSAFGNTRPQTYEGTLALTRAHLALGQRDAARAVLSPFWRKEKLEAAQEAAILKEFAGALAASDHRYRMEHMLYEDRVSSAGRVAKLAGGEALTRAWAAVIRNQKDAGKLLNAVPKSQRSAGFIFAKTRYLRRSKQYREAAALILTAPRDATSLIDPDEWWTERRVLSRELLDIGDAKTAYRIAAAHSAESPAKAVDAEFHAGWYALRALGDAKTASAHFARIAQMAEGPISNARAYYWLARAAEAGGPGNANTYYTRAATYGTAFYGQLAAAKLGHSKLAATYPEPTQTDRKKFAVREPVRAIRRLEETNHAWRAASLYRNLARELDSPGELALLAVMAEKRGDHTMALRVGKIAASRGINIGALAHPIGAIPASAKIPGGYKPLAYAIARQESEFNISAVSSAGARGLLQLLPGTAKEMARKSGLAYSRQRLTDDPAYNAALGSAYLGEQLERFNGSYIMTFAGYNAGPRRVGEWVERYGDPRGKPIEAVVDWIERIPYHETRNYVQRVMENLQVYKMRLTGRFSIQDDIRVGK